MASIDIERVLSATTHYATLGCKPDVGAGDLSRSYRSLSKTLHPDKCNLPKAEAAFKKLAEAHAVLGDPLRRRTYDREQHFALQQQQQQHPGHSPSSSGFRAESHNTAPWADPYPTRVPKPVYETPEEIAIREKQLAVMDRNQLQTEFNELQRDLHDERRQAKERTKRHEADLTVAKRVANEARAEREKVKAYWQQRLHEEKTRYEREKQELVARVALLEAELASALQRAPSSSASASGVSPAVVGPQLPDLSASSAPSAPATSKSIEKDEYGNFVVVEKDARGAYTVSAERLAAQRKHSSSNSGHAAPSGQHAGSSAASAGRAAAESMSDGLVELLQRLGLDHYRDQLEEEELFDVALLRSMGPTVQANMEELGMRPVEAQRLRQGLGL